MGAYLFMIGCGPAEFTGSSDAQSKAGATEAGTLGDANGSIAQNEGACDPDEDCDCDEDNDEAEDMVPQPTVAEFSEILKQDPALAAVVEEENRCYISGGNGHGTELCMTGDKAAISGLNPIEIKGDQICVPVATLRANLNLFAAAKFGRCN